VLADVLDHQEEPFGDTSIFAHYHLMRAARRAGVPVVISGQGGDELLLGYPSMVTAYLGHLVARGRLSRAAHEVHAWAASAEQPPTRVLAGAMAHALPLRLRDRLRARYVASHARLASPALRSTANRLRFARDARRGTFDDYIAQVFTRFAIPHLTHYDDRNAMAFSVESRMPFLDYRLVELMFSASTDALFADGFTKRVLRESMAGVLPETVRTRRDKVGFHTPLAKWLRDANGDVATFMTRDRLEALGAVDPLAFESANRRLLAGEDGAALDVWRSYIVQRWAERFDVEEISWA
jgi:asparagine synthase (glutamine-hydrolysing)